MARSKRFAVAEFQPRLIQPAALDALHREGNGTSGADGVEPQLVAALRCAQHGVGIADTAQRAESEQALVFDAHAARAQRVNVLAADGASDAAFAGLGAGCAQLLR